MPMFIFTSRYLVPVEEIDANLSPHRAWLQQHYEDGSFLVSGPQEPRVGGAIVAYFESMDAASLALRDDPFVKAAFGDYEIVEFASTGFPHRSAGFDQFLSAAATGGASG
jgi:uncharacterized protein YciI